MNTMTYKGFAAHVEYSEDDGCFVGHIDGIRDVVGFHGKSAAELKAAFENAVNDYTKVSTRSDRPAAKLVPIETAGQRIGVAQGAFEVPETIDAHNDEIARSFN